MRFLAVLLLAAACGGSPKRAAETSEAHAMPKDPIPSTAGPDCAVVADKLAIVVLADNPDAQGAMRDHVKTRCSQDAWSDEARNCFATVENDQEAEGCKTKLTDAQRAKIGGPHDHDSKANAASTGAPPRAPGNAQPAATPAKPAKPATKGKPTTRSGDPCEGGE